MKPNRNNGSVYLCSGCLCFFKGHPRRTLCPDCEFYQAVKRELYMTSSLDEHRATIILSIKQRSEEG